MIYSIYEIVLEKIQIRFDKFFSFGAFGKVKKIIYFYIDFVENDFVINN